MPESKTPIGRGSIRGILGRAPAEPRRCGRVPVDGLAPRCELPVPGTGLVYPSRPMAKALAVALLSALLLAVGDAPGSVAARQDVSIPMDDGVSIAATLYVPDGAAPAGGWPAIVFLHGLAGNRQQMNALVEGYGLDERGLRDPHLRRARPRAVRTASSASTARARCRTSARSATGSPRAPTSPTRRSAPGASRTAAAGSSTRSSPAFPGRPS